MTSSVCRTPEEHQTRTAQVQRDRETACNTLCLVGWSRPQAAQWAVDHYPLPELAQQGIRGKTGERFRVVPSYGVTGRSVLEHQTSPRHTWCVLASFANQDRDAILLAISGAEGLADLFCQEAEVSGCWMDPKVSTARFAKSYPALVAKAGS